jgi:hypothetical protein
LAGEIKMVHHLFAVEGYIDALQRIERFFHHRPYKNGRYYSRVRKLQLFGIFEFYDFTIEEQAEKEFMADLRSFFYEDLQPYWKDKEDRLNKTKVQRIFSLDFFPFNLFKYEISARKDNNLDNRKEHFKKYVMWKVFEAMFYPLRIVGFSKPDFHRESFLRKKLEQEGNSFLLQGFYVGKIADRKHDGVEYV